MKYLVDVNVWSELNAPLPNAAVLAWLRKHEAELAVDSIILAEIYVGILCVADGKRKRELSAWFEKFSSSVVCVGWDDTTARSWARLYARLKREGKPMSVLDSLIAATALTHGLVMVTRNITDFSRAGVKILNPFAV